MADIASLVVKVSTDGVNKAQSDLDKLAKQSKKTSDGIDEMSKMMKRATDIINKDPFQKYKQSLFELNTLYRNGLLTQSQYTKELKNIKDQFEKTKEANKNLTKSFGLLNVALSSIAIGSLIKETAQLADTYKLTEGRLSLVTKNTIELATAQQEILKISQNTRQSYADTIDLYTRVARSTQDLGKSQSDILKFTEIVNKSLVISGASAENSKAAIMQLGQALGSGVLQGDELRSILENAPRLAEAIAKGMSKTVSELKTLGEQGKLTAEEVFNAIQKQGDAIDKEFGKMPKTIGQATTQMGNSILELVGTMDKITGASGFVADKISSLSKTMDDFSSNARVASSSVFEQKTVDDITIKANQIASEIQSLQTKLKENDGALWFGLDDRTQSEYINKIKRLEQQMEQLGQTAVDVLWKTSQGTKSAVLSSEQVKKQVDDALGGFKAYYKAIGDEEVVLAIRRHELIEKYKDLTDNQIDAIINSERDKNNKTEKLAEEWAKRKIEIATNISIAEQDKLAEPFIKLEAKYKEDLEHFKGVNGAKERLTAEYNAQVARLQEDLTKKFNEEEEKKAKKSAEWQVKLLEANEKYNDEIIKMQDEMYGTDSSVEQWYNNQLEYLGKLSQEAGATSEELQTLLDKIETLKAMKLEKQTISFKVEQSFYQSFESNLADSIEGAFNGDLNFKKFFKNIGNDLLKTVSSSFAGIGTNALRGNYSGALSAIGALAVGSSVSASEIANIMNSGGTFDEASNTITTSGGSKINVSENGSGTVNKAGSDVMSLVNTVSTLKTAYTALTGGLSSSVLSMFQSGASGLSSLGFAGAGSALGEFGVGFASPWATQAASAAASQAGATAGLYGSGVGQVSGAQMAGGYASGALMGAGLGYGIGSIGDKIFGAKTKAGTYGAIGGAIGSVVPVIGTIAGAVIGSLIGGMFGTKKTKDTGLQFFQGVNSSDNLNTDMVKGYADWQKKSWFSNKKGTDYSNLTSTQLKQIEGLFDTYDYLLKQLGDADKIWLDAGKYSGESFQTQITKNFITAFTDVNQNLDSTIYNSWVEYAKSIDKTVTEALQESISSFITEKRTFEIWQVGASSVEGLAKKAQFAKEDLDNLANSLGATGVTVENYLQRYDEAIKESFTPETITSWKNLGDALMTATDAAKAYTDELSKIEDTYRKQILANQAANAKNIDAVFKNLSLQGLTVAQTFKQLTGKESPKTVKEWEALGEELKETEQVLSNEILTAFQNIGAELKQAVTNTKLLASSLLNAGDGLGALKTLMSLEEFKYSDFMNGDNFNANAFNVAYAKKEMEIASNLANTTSQNALSMQNAMQTFNGLITKIKGTALSEYGVLFAENYKNFAYGFAEAATGSKELTTSFNNLVGISNELAKSFAYEQGMTYVPNGQGIATLQNAMMQASIVSQSAYSSRMGKMLYGMEEIALDKTFATLAGELRRGTISADEYSRALEFINNEFADTIDLMEDTEAQLKRIADAQYNIWSTAVTSTEFYFTKITEQADAYVATLKETTEGYKGAAEAIGRLNSLTEVLAFTSSNINIEGMRNYLGGNADLTQEAYVKSTATLISNAAKLLSAEITTADAKQAAEAIKQKESFAGVDALKIRDLSLAFENLSAYDATSLEGTLSLLNKELINKNITDAQYVDLFNIGLDIYRDVEQEQLNTLKSIERIVADISAYQRELLYGDLSTLSISEKYAGAKDDTMGLYAQAKAALIGGDLDLFETLYSDFEGVSANFLTVSKDFVANNEAYVQDFTSVFGVLADLKSLATTSGLNVGSDLSYLKLDGSHANGLDYVPFDGYIAQLHKGERVQTANDARSTDALASEIRLLRQDLKDSNQTIAFNTQRTAKILDRWDADGQPEERVV